MISHFLGAIVRARVLYLTVFYFSSVVSSVQIAVVVDLHDSLTVSLADSSPHHDCDDREHDDDDDQDARKADDDCVLVIVLGEEIVNNC